MGPINDWVLFDSVGEKDESNSNRIAVTFICLGQSKSYGMSTLQVFEIVL